MFDLQRIGKTIAETEKYLKELDSYKLSKEDLKESKNYHASSMLVFAILNRLIDLGSEIITAEELGAPNTYQDIMNILCKGNIVNKEQAEKINKLISKRNIFAHFYGEITEKELFDTIKDIKEVNSFLKTIKRRANLKE